MINKMKILNLKNKNRVYPEHTRRGYTIIETMISISLFLILVITGIGSLLNANVVHNKSRNVRAIMDNLSFIMEDMSRNLRTGYNYRCYDVNHPWNNGSDVGSIVMETPRSCENGQVLVFEEAIVGIAGYPDDQWVYKISSTNGVYTIWKSTLGGAVNTFVPLHGPEVVIDDNVFSFSVLGAEPSSASNNNKQQPLVIIRLAGNIVYKNLDSPFSIQTMVSQRLIDVVNP